MEDIKVGELYRTQNGKIHKWSKGRTYIGKDKIVNHSFNIIDLIQTDDIGIMNCYGILVKKFLTKDDILELKLGNYKLLKLVTKEQFSNVEYKVEED